MNNQEIINYKHVYISDLPKQYKLTQDILYSIINYSFSRRIIKMGKKINGNLALHKFFAAFFVITIHIKFPGLFGNIISNFAFYAVLFFFLSAGYFYEFSDSSHKTIKSVKKLLALLLFSILIYCTNGIIRGTFFNNFKSILSAKELIKVVVFNDFLFIKGKQLFGWFL